MSVINKSSDVAVIAWQVVANAASLAGTVTGLPATALACGFVIRLARQSTTAFSTGYPKIRIEVSSKASGNDNWGVAQTFTPFVGASIAGPTISGAVSAGATTVTLSAGTNVSQGEIFFLGDASPANYELVRVKSGTSTITLEEACTYGHSNGAQCYGQGEIYAATVDLVGFKRCRVVVDNAGGGVSVLVDVQATFASDFS